MFARTRHARRHAKPIRLVPVLVEKLEARSLLSATSSDETIYEVPGYNAQPSEHLLVRFREGEVQVLTGTTLGGALPLVSGLYEVNINKGTSVEQALAAYKASSHVIYAQEDFQLTVTRTPNDPGYSQTWAMNNIGQAAGLFDADIDAAEAWDRTVGSRTIIVAVIDTGIDYRHPDLAANIWINTREIAGNGIDDDGDGYIDDVRGWDFINNDSDPFDDNGHGTHVSGTIGAVGNNGIGVAGVAWNVQIMALKFLGSNGGGSTADAIRAIDYARINGAKILNASWGGGGYSQALGDAIERARQAGIIFVAAAGNSGTNNDAVASYPANYSSNNVVSVAATDRYDTLAYYSNFGVTQVDLAAPGSSIYSTLPNNSYGTYSGTSMATPHVAGALALVWSYFPQYTYRQVIDQVLNNVDPLAGLEGKVATGGRLNVSRALSAGTASSGPSITSANWSGATLGTVDKLRITFSKAINPTTFGADDIALTAPNGTVIAITRITIVAGSGNTQFDISFAPRSAPGVYRVSIGPQIKDIAGNLMNQDGDTLSGEATQDKFNSQFTLAAIATYTWTGSTAIRDNATTTISLPITTTGIIDDINVRIALTHTYDSDLRIFLIDPSGIRVQLFNRRGGSGDNISATFDDEANLPISLGRAPFNGSFKPEQALSGLDGRQLAGVWRLEIQDLAWADVGRITSFSLIVTLRAGVASRGLDGSDESTPTSPDEITLARVTTVNLIDQPAAVPQFGTPTFNGLHQGAPHFTVYAPTIRSDSATSTLSPPHPLTANSGQPIPTQTLDELLANPDQLLASLGW